jgi:hypothetical protein
MSPNLLAFNMFASEMRLVLRDTALLTRAEMQMGIEKVIGNRWKAMTPDEKEKHIDKARVEQARLIAEGGMPQAPASIGRSKKQKNDSSGLDGGQVLKRRRGRPPKTGPTTSTRPKSQQPHSFMNNMMNNGMLHKATSIYSNSGQQMHSHFMDMNHNDDEDSHGYGSLYNINDHVNFNSMSDLFMPFNSSSLPVVVNATHEYDDEPHAKDMASSFLQHDVVNVLGSNGLKATTPPGGVDLTGTSVQGVIDGTFDTGYFLTVRLASGQILRGMMYREDVCMRQIGAHSHALK